MADSGSFALSKATKKNLKKRAKKRAAATPGKNDQNGKIATAEEVKALLNQQLQEAKAVNDKEAMQKIRQQIWIVNDMLAGVKTDLPDDRLEELMGSLPLPEEQKAEHRSRTPTPEPQETECVPDTSDVPQENGTVKSEPEAVQDSDKRLRNLRKKLNQINRIKEKMAKGEQVEKSQMEKVKTEAAILEEIEDIELELATAKLGR